MDNTMVPVLDVTVSVAWIVIDIAPSGVGFGQLKIVRVFDWLMKEEVITGESTVQEIRFALFVTEMPSSYGMPTAAGGAGRPPSAASVSVPPPLVTYATLPTRL